MTWSIFGDTDRQAAILVSDDPLFALGPVVVADTVAEAIQVMNAFAGHLEAPPDQLPTIRLMTEWTAFLGVISGEVVGVLTDAPAALSADPGANLGEGSPAIPDGPTQPDGPPEDAAPESSGISNGAGEIATGEPEVELDATIEPAREPEAGRTGCWNCSGHGTVDIGGEEAQCGVCGGRGTLAAVGA